MDTSLGRLFYSCVAGSRKSLLPVNCSVESGSLKEKVHLMFCTE